MAASSGSGEISHGGEIARGAGICRPVLLWNTGENASGEIAGTVSFLATGVAVTDTKGGVFSLPTTGMRGFGVGVVAVTVLRLCALKNELLSSGAGAGAVMVVLEDALFDGSSLTFLLSEA